MANKQKTRRLFDDAVATLSAGNLIRAKELTAKLVKADDKNFSCWHLKAVIHGELGEIDLAEIAFVTAIGFAPSKHERAKVYEQISLFLMQNQLPSRAVKYLKKLHKLEPSRDEITCYLGDAFRLSNQYKMALLVYDEAIDKCRKSTVPLAGKAIVLQELGRLAEAAEVLAKLLAIKPNDVDANTRLADCYTEINDFDSAERLLQSAIEAQPTDMFLKYRLALLYRDFGEIEEATAWLESVVLEKQAPATVFYNYARIKTFEASDPIIGEIRRRLDALAGNHLSPPELQGKTELLFALGKIWEDCQQYDQAFECWQQGNNIKRQTYEYSVKDDRNRVAAIKAIFSDELFRTQQYQEPDARTPVFIIGLPRSGSTLCEQILASHSEVQGLGELTLLPELLGDIERTTSISYPRVLTSLDVNQLTKLRTDYLSRLAGKINKHYFTDKLPGNSWLVGLIHLIFPRSPIINVFRNPVDAGFSCFKHLFSGTQKFAYNLAEIREYIDLQRELMRFWHELLPGAIYDLRYEDLVMNPEETIRAMMSFCGLSFQQECLDYHRTKRAVKSASAAQIRQPLHRSAIGFSRHYEKYLQEFADHYQV